ncbi:MAG: ABC transporter permease [Burkholderiales bacterium]|nr:ABC transporter permease [Burkholderiales bacterium]
MSATATTLQGSRFGWRRQARWMRPTLTITGLLVLWEIAGKLGWMNVALIPRPSTILAALWLQAGPAGTPPYGLWAHLGASLYRILAGILLAIVFGSIVGLLIGLTKWGRRILQPVVSAMMPVPTLAWTPILLLIFGIDDRTTITVVFLSASFQIIYNVAAGLDALSDKAFWVAQSMGASRMRCVWIVALPGIFPFLITGVKLGIGFAWRSLIAAEMLAASGFGLGFMIYDAVEYLSMDTIFGGILLIALMGYILENIVMGRIEAVTTKRWGVQVER